MMPPDGLMRLDKKSMTPASLADEAFEGSSGPRFCICMLPCLHPATSGRWQMLLSSAG